MDNVIYTKSYEAMPFDRAEILRYSGILGNAPELDSLIDKCIKEAENSFVYKVCYREFKIAENGSVLDLGFLKTDSQKLKVNLKGCESIVLFAATVGIGIDRLIARHASISPTKALLFQAIGTERIETLCDTFNREVTEHKKIEGYTTRPRFSAGYGDFSIGSQREIFAVLDCSRRLGIALNESMLMSPSKSVTAIIGVSKE